MLPSDNLDDFVRTGAKALGLPVEEAWVPAIATHLQRLLDAAVVLDESELRVDDLAPRFDP